MEPYHKRKMLEDKYGKLIHLKPFSDDIGIADNSQQQFAKHLQDIADEEGLKRAYETKDGLYQHYKKVIYRWDKRLSPRPYR